MGAESLENGDWVRIETGEVGKVVLVSRASAFVEIPIEGTDSNVFSYLLSQLTKIEPPTE